MAYRPIRFVPDEKLATSDKLLLAFDALAISRITSILPPTGKIIHGLQHTTAIIPLATLIKQVRALLAKIAPPPTQTRSLQLALNKHCNGCEFRSRCRAHAEERDDLSLLATLKAKGRKAKNAKGIFTVTQLSYTFRPPRQSASSHAKSQKHDPSLKALAIRKAQ